MLRLSRAPLREQLRGSPGTELRKGVSLSGASTGNINRRLNVLMRGMILYASKLGIRVKTCKLHNRSFIALLEICTHNLISPQILIYFNALEMCLRENRRPVCLLLELNCSEHTNYLDTFRNPVVPNKTRYAIAYFCDKLFLIFYGP